VKLTAAIRKTTGVLAVASASWLVLTALFELDARLLGGRMLGWLDGLLFRLVMRSDPHDASAQETFGFLVLYTTILALVVLVVAAPTFAFLRRARHHDQASKAV